MSHKITIQSSGHQFDCPEGSTILAAGLKAGFMLPYNCRSGLCRTCKSTIVTGEVHYPDQPLSNYLSDVDVTNGAVLLCQAHPTSDMVIDARELTDLATVQPLSMRCRIFEMTRLAEDIMRVRLRLPMNEHLRYLPGQHVSLSFDGVVCRDYSIANPCNAAGVTEIELHIRHLPNGALTDRLFLETRLRSVLDIELPLGSFFVRQDSARPILFLATGTGFAPVKAMVEDLLERGVNRERPLEIYWGGRTKKDLYLLELAQAWTEHENVRFVPVLSRPDPSEFWAGRIGYVQDQVLIDHDDLSGHDVYACGSPVMIEAARELLEAKADLDPASYFADAFLTKRDAPPRGGATSERVGTTYNAIRDMTDDAFVDPRERASVIRPFNISHGTLECRSLAVSKKFYEEFLGLECVVHSPTSIAVRCGLKFHITAVEVGNDIKPASLLHHWGLDLETRDDVDRAYQAVLDAKDRYGFRDIKPLLDRHGVYSFFFQDFDGNWWEIQHYPGYLNDDIFDFGDRYTLLEGA